METKKKNEIWPLCQGTWPSGTELPAAQIKSQLLLRELSEQAIVPDSVRRVKVGEDKLADEVWVKLQDLHAVRVQLSDDLGLRSKQAEVVGEV